MLSVGSRRPEDPITMKGNAEHRESWVGTNAAPLRATQHTNPCYVFARSRWIYQRGEATCLSPDSSIA